MTFRTHANDQQIKATIRSRVAAEPYDNVRPINVPARFDGQTLFQCLTAMHPHVGQSQWREWFQSGHILDGDRPVPMETIVRGGNQFQHLFPDWVEPAVNSQIEILWEDDAIIAVAKPAPLPVHPSGRFNRNTLTSLLAGVYSAKDLRVVHRLDANTTGVMVFARTPAVATTLRAQFESNQVVKSYLVRCVGSPEQGSFTCSAPIARQRGPAGLRDVDLDGDPAFTRFRVIRRLDDGTSILNANPKTGRTHQIRIHLWSLGIPVQGDPAYLPERKLATTQTLAVGAPPMCLHAGEIQLCHPVNGETIRIECPNPNWFSELNDRRISFRESSARDATYTARKAT